MPEGNGGGMNRTLPEVQETTEEQYGTMNFIPEERKRKGSVKP